jgi:hypothetical protein
MVNKDDFIKTRSGQQLYGLLPEVYRTRDLGDTDDTGDLARFLDACGQLLDQIRQTLDQRLADAFPDNPASGLACQPWLLPYFADLLDVRMVSPDEAGRRDEVANGVAWRQRKGTLKVLEQIAEKVGRFEVEMQEGWKRVATTPQVGMPRLLAPALGESKLYDEFLQHPNWAARHPSLPAVMSDLRYPTRALQVETLAGSPPQNPAAKLTSFMGQPIWWRQVNRHGVPCFPDSYDDVSRRTPDVRTPNWGQGHAHPKRALLHAPPPLGFFGPDPFTSSDDLSYTEAGEHLLQDQHVKGTLQVSAGRLTLRRCTVKNLLVTVSSHDEFVLDAEDCLFESVAVGAGAASFEGCTVLGTTTVFTLVAANCIFNGSVTVVEGGSIGYSRIPLGLTANIEQEVCTTETPIFFAALFDQPGAGVLRPDSPLAILFGAEDAGELGAYHQGRENRPVRIPLTGTLTLALPSGFTYVVTDLILEGSGMLRVTQGVLNLKRVASSDVRVESGSPIDDLGQFQPVLTAKDCLFGQVAVPSGLARLEYCTVLTHWSSQSLQASEVIFVADLTLAPGSETNPHCIRFSRIPEGFTVPFLRSLENSTETPIFYQFEFDSGGQMIRRRPVFGEPGCATLHPASAEAIRFGAEDGGEMGAYHEWHYSLLVAAVQDKLNDFLPVGMEAVIIPDLRLHRLPWASCEG